MKKNDAPLSLSQHFDAPSDYVGEFGWIVGYSADAAFLKDAAERFSRKTSAQRAWEGVHRLALMLDPGSPQLAPVDVPGVAHLPLRASLKPFRLLHAKVAVLGFRHEKQRSNWMVRLIVSTGNWTRQTLEESLDVCWAIDITEQDVTRGDKAQLCADLRAAFDFVNYVREAYDLRVLGATVAQLDEWLDKVPPSTLLPPPRFFDNRTQSFLKQLPELVKIHAGPASRNHLSMGAGFFEAPAGQGVPAVLEGVSIDLRRAGLLTASPEIAVFVNENACQAVASGAGSIRKKGWEIRPAGRPKFFPQNVPRALHAKFIFSASYRNSSNKCSTPWVYLGSGNLTGPGFTSAMSSSGGNLEAGVVFAPRGLCWYENDTDDPRKVVSNLLPVQWESEVKDLDNLSPGGEMPEREDDFVAPPVAWLDWEADDSGAAGWLMIPDRDRNVEFTVLCGEEACKRQLDRFRWPSDQPRQVEVQWEDGQSRRAFVPVRDEHGRFASGKLPNLSHADAWLQLANFPMPPEEEEVGDEGTAETSPDGTINAGDKRSIASYPIRDMMALVERIARKQTDVDRVNWSAWITRLEQTMFQMTECAVLREFKTLAMNPISPLRYPEFRPVFAEDNSSNEGLAYERVLDRVEVKWGVSEMRRLEAM
ncbi:hypothetical protein [Ensifer sp. YR511]|uniref:hypothetical protein n=1 Tax=Ensifer sp. YR511 TaxID=1855294 RepID=UPI000882D5B4|nr:hypothetical protein [Ensifer sp. YR511]SDN52920.1 hypothetical protein SAMN05216328_12885 [Ensifer sp. YR511]